MFMMVYMEKIHIFLDMTPVNGWSDIALSDGVTFIDSANTLNINQVSHNASSVTLSINLLAGDYDYWINSAVNPPTNMSAAGTASAQVHLRNTGSSTWYNEAQYAASPTTRRPMRPCCYQCRWSELLP